MRKGGSPVRRPDLPRRVPSPTAPRRMGHNRHRFRPRGGRSSLATTLARSATASPIPDGRGSPAMGWPAQPRPWVSTAAAAHTALASGQTESKARRRLRLRQHPGPGRESAPSGETGGGRGQLVGMCQAGSCGRRSGSTWCGPARRRRAGTSAHRRRAVAHAPTAVSRVLAAGMGLPRPDHLSSRWRLSGRFLVRRTVICCP